MVLGVAVNVKFSMRAFLMFPEATPRPHPPLIVAGDFPYENPAFGYVAMDRAPVDPLGVLANYD